MRWQDHITVNPLVVHGQAGIRGTRIPVAVVLANLAEIVVNGTRRAFLAPSLVGHYVVRHRYLPPREFIDAVLASEDTVTLGRRSRE